MKTSTWHPASPSGSSNPDILGIDQRFALTCEGKKPDELSAVSAAYLAILYLRAGKRISISTLEGVEVAHNRAGKLTGEQEFLNAMYLLEQCMNVERKAGVEEAFAYVNNRTGVDLETMFAELDAARQS